LVDRRAISCAAIKARVSYTVCLRLTTGVAFLRSLL
jgi:hypothetical protein